MENTIQTSTKILKIIENLQSRGNSMCLPHGGLPEVFSPHLAKLIERTGGPLGPIGLQFVAQPEKENKVSKSKVDPLMEDHHEIAPGLVYKYQGQIKENGEIIQHGRCLWTITRFCASYCRFCTRGREVGILPGTPQYTSGAIASKIFLSDEDIAQVATFIKEHNEINEIILSGGDPLTAPKEYLTKIIRTLKELQSEGHLDFVRIGTRLPIHNPIIIQNWHYELLAELKNPYLMVHVNHPAELTPETILVLNNFRRISLANILSQSVLLQGVNNSTETLQELFSQLTKEGIRPYYVFQNDDVYWAKHFTIQIKEAIKIWGSLRKRLSGIAATARLVIDVPFGYGKIPMPEGEAWEVNYNHFHDFQNNKHLL